LDSFKFFSSWLFFKIYTSLKTFFHAFRSCSRLFSSYSIIPHRTIFDSRLLWMVSKSLGFNLPEKANTLMWNLCRIRKRDNPIWSLWKCENSRKFNWN
jgi:hypothetical protein